MPIKPNRFGLLDKDDPEARRRAAENPDFWKVPVRTLAEEHRGRLAAGSEAAEAEAARKAKEGFLAKHPPVDELPLEAMPGQEPTGGPVRLPVGVKLQPQEGPDVSVGPYGYTAKDWNANLWVAPNAKKTLEGLVSSHPQEVLDRLRYAYLPGNRLAVYSPPETLKMGEHGEKVHPVLNLPGGTQHYYKILPNSGIHAPVGYGLFPRASRSGMRQALGDTPERITWLEPGGQQFQEHPEGFDYLRRELPRDPTVTSLPVAQFRDLADLVNYKAPAGRPVGGTWRPSGNWDLNAFVEGGQTARRDGPTPPPAPAAGPRAPRRRRIPLPAPVPIAPDAITAPISVAANLPPDQANVRRAQLEQAFREAPGYIDSPERVALWPQIAEATAAVGDRPQAAIAYQNAFWHAQDPAQTQAAAYGWLRAEDPEARPMPLVEEFDRDLSNPHPGPEEVRRVAARTVMAGLTSAPALRARAQAIGEFLDRHEAALGLKANWLARLALSRNGSDVLGLARTADRMRARMEHAGQGASGSLDFPRFLQTGGLGTRGHELLARFPALTQALAGWHSPGGTHWNDPYRDMMLAVARARLGDHDNARRMLQGVRFPTAATGPGAQVRQWLSDALQFRAQQALEGRPANTPLPEQLAGPAHMANYAIRRARGLFRTIDPTASVERLDPPIAIPAPNNQPAEHLAGEEGIRNRLEAVWQEIARHPDGANAFYGANEIARNAQRLGELYAVGALGRIIDWLRTPGQTERLARDTNEVGQGGNDMPGKLLGNLLRWTAHYGRRDMVDAVVALAGMTIQQQARYPNAQIITAAMMVKEGSDAMRLSGMDDQLGRLIQIATQAVTHGQPLERVHPSAIGVNGGTANGLLAIADAWASMGRPEMARPILDAVAGWVDRDQINSRLASRIGGPPMRWGAQAGETGQAQAPPIFLADLVANYVRAAGKLDAHEAADRIGRFLQRAPSLNAQAAGTDDYSNQHMRVLDALVHALTTGRLGQSDQARRWADDYESPLRRKMQSDLQAALAAQGIR